MSRRLRVRVGRRQGPPAGLAATTPMTSVSRFDSIWTFDGEYQVGQYANGDPFVVGPVTLTKIEPEVTTAGENWSDGTEWEKHGSMLNPVPANLPVGYGRVRAAGYDPALNVAKGVTAANPLTLQPNDALVSAISHPTPDNRPSLIEANVLSVVSEAPTSGSFRRGYSANKSTTTKTVDDIDLSVLPKLAHVAHTPSPTDFASEFERCWKDHREGWTGRKVHPDRAMPDYGRDLSARLGEGMLLLMLDFTDAQKLPLARNLIQVGIDFYALVLNGGSWPPDGGHAMGRKMPILLAGVLLGDADMLAIGSTSTMFGEEGQTFYVSQADVDRSLDYADPQHDDYRPVSAAAFPDGYTSSMLGVAEYGIRHSTDPFRDNPHWENASYRRAGLVGPGWYGHVLAAHILGLKSQWNHDALFDYTDRFAIRENFAGSTGTFQNTMWNAYRLDYGPLYQGDIV